MEKTKVLQIDNYVIYEEKDNENKIAVYRIKDVAGSWSVGIKSDTMAFLNLSSLIQDKELHKFLAMWVMVMHRACLIVPDLDFIQDYADITQKMFDRYAENDHMSTEDEDADALNDVEAAHAAMEEFKESHKAN